MDRERTDAVWKKYGRSLWNFAGSYGLGIALMLILLVLTFAGTLHQVRLSSAMGSEAAIESFFGAAYVLIPLGGENSLISLPLPGMGITCVLLFANLLIGGVFRIRWTWRHAGVLVAHGGILLLLAGIMLGNKMTVVYGQGCTAQRYRSLDTACRQLPSSSLISMAVSSKRSARLVTSACHVFPSPSR